MKKAGKSAYLDYPKKGGRERGAQGWDGQGERCHCDRGSPSPSPPSPHPDLPLPLPEPTPTQGEPAGIISGQILVNVLLYHSNQPWFISLGSPWIFRLVHFDVLCFKLGRFWLWLVFACLLKSSTGLQSDCMGSKGGGLVIPKTNFASELTEISVR